MTHSEACRIRFDEIEKKKLDKQIEEEAARIPEPPSETVHGMDVEQAQEQPLTGGASSSSGPVWYLSRRRYRWQVRVRMK